KTVAAAETAPQQITGDGSATFTATAKLPNPSLWSVETPNLYSAVATVESNGKARDAERITFGVRTVTWDADKGFFLNGKSVMIKRYRNSPSIIIWSMGNEEWTMMPQSQGVRVIDEMIARSHELDPTRLCTAAVNASFEAHFPERLDVMGYNYNLKVIDDWHKAHPKTPG